MIDLRKLFQRGRASGWSVARRPSYPWIEPGWTWCAWRGPYVRTGDCETEEEAEMRAGMAFARLMEFYD